MSDVGQTRKYSLRVDVFRFDPESELKTDIAPCPSCANIGSPRYSITSSANVSKVGCTLMPNCVAVLALTPRIWAGSGRCRYSACR